jgi:2,4-dienoyl-CoA reductase-like NADH-dependent reductase (Old Yellow Enzyme family)
MPSLFDPLPLGELTLKNRILLAPLTRCRAGKERVPNALMAEYYGQRAGAGLILTEATVVSPQGVGYPDTPGIWSREQVEGWKLCTQAVHERGGLIFLQLWHVGRVSDPSYFGGELPVAPSAVAAPGFVSLLRPKRRYPTPRALLTEEVPGIVQAFKLGAENAQKAGFDGVEIHGANGYLLDQFLQDGSNKREDEYGGPIQNRARLHLDVADACVSVWGAGRVGMHIAPRCDAHGMGDSDPAKTFGYLARELGKRKLAFLCARESPYDFPRLGPALKEAFGGVYIANEKIETRAAGQQLLDAGEADAIAYGRSFLANPDLPERFRRDAALNPPDAATFYAPGPNGYTDYPFLASTLNR